MKKYYIAIVSALLLFCGYSLDAQLVGTPGAVIGFNTNANGRSLGHLQAGAFGDVFNPGANWTAIGQAPFPAVGAPYGFRMNRNSQLAVFNFIGGTTSATEEDLVLGFGEDKENQFRLRFIYDQFNPTDFADILVANAAANVGIGKDPNDLVRLDVESNSLFNPTISGVNTNTGFGIYGESPYISVYARCSPVLGSNPSIAVYGRSNSASSAYGVYATSGGSGTDYAVFGTAPNAFPDWAGYFNGRSFTTAGAWTPSDKRLKSNIVREENAIDQIMRLKTYTYNFKTAEYDFMSLPEVRQHGFLSQELEEVFPEMVTQVIHPIYDPENPEKEASTFEFKGVNYEQLIPVLTTAIQEQQLLIESLTERIAELEGQDPAGNFKGFEELGIRGQAELFQNNPNPFNERTTIRYTLPEGFNSARIIIFNMNGQQIAAYDNLRGEDLQIEGSLLEAGMYLYSLIVDGREVDVKRMLLTK